MNFLRKIDTYLLENKPVLWHSKLHYLLAFGIPLNILFFTIGYFIPNDQFLQHEELDRYYSQSFLVFIHLLSDLIIIVLWGLAYFKNNAIRRYYPIRKGYYVFLSAQLLLGFSLLILPYYSSEAGMCLKVKTMMSKDELAKEIKLINQAMLFLPQSSSDYYLDYKIYPKAFPSRYLRYDAVNQIWNDEQLELKDRAPYSAQEHLENSDTVAGNIYQFYKEKTVSTGSGCNRTSFTYVSEFYHLEDKATYEHTSFYNYSSIFMDENSCTLPMQRLWETAYAGNTTFSMYAPKLFGWVENDKKDSILALLKGFEKILLNHNVNHYLKPNDLVNVLSENNYRLEDMSVVSRNAYMSYGKLQWADDCNYGFNEGDLKQVYANTCYAYNGYYSLYSYLVPLFVVFLLTFLFVLLDFIPFVSLLLALPVGAGLLILNGFITFLIATFNTHSTIPYFIQYLFVVAFIMYFILQSLRSKVNKKLTAIAVAIGYFIIPLVPILIIGFMDELTKYSVPGVCSSYTDVHHTFWFDLLMNPYYSFAFGVLFWLLYLGTIRRFYAKPD